MKKTLAFILSMFFLCSNFHVCNAAEEPQNVYENILFNSDFETEKDGIPDDWRPIGGSWESNAYVTYDNTVYHGESGHAVKIKSSGSKNPYVRQIIDVYPDTKYTVSAWVRKETTEQIVPEVSLKYECHRENFIKSGKKEVETSLGLSTVSEKFFTENDEDGEWKQVTTSFLTPTGCRAIALYLRLYSKGTVWFDDISFVQVCRTPIVHITTDSTFYYPSQKTGVATATFNTGGDHGYQYENCRVNFYLKDGDRILAKQLGTTYFEGKAGFQFDRSLMQKMKYAYTMEAETVDLQGNRLDSSITDIYVYPRPTSIDENCQYKNSDGSLFIPTLGYHIPSEWWKGEKVGDTVVYNELAQCKALGINVVQVPYGYAYQYPEKPAMLNQIVAACGQVGIKALICLYHGMVPAAHENNITSSRIVVEAFKNNENVFGYAVQDEPFLAIPNAFEDGHKLLKQSYQMIRDIDDMHPVYLLEASTRNFKSVTKYCDVMACDPYPSNLYRPGNCVRDFAEMAAQATRGLKPFYTVLQSFTYGGYYPTGDEMRNFWYQGLLADHYGGGYFGVDKSLIPTDGSPNQPLLESPLGETITTFAKAEQEFALDAFKYGNYPIVNRGLERNYEYRSVLKNGDIYLVVLNRNSAQDTNLASGYLPEESIQAVIPAVSTNGLVSLKNGIIEALYGCKASDITLTGDTFTVKLSLGQTAVFKISGVDTTKLSDVRFTDIGDYAWATEAIETLSNNGILKNCTERIYAPANATTRGEFAMYLIETLGIAAHNDSEGIGQNAAQGFKDVAKDTYYWETLNTGKAAGVLLGDQDNKFYPDNTITRQDAMTMTARALIAADLYYGKGDLSALKGFLDKDCITTFAEAAVSNMVCTGLVRGNEDGALDPSGVVTRAEAAVICGRIMGYTDDLWKENMDMLTEEEKAAIWYGLNYTEGAFRGKIWNKIWNFQGKSYLAVGNKTKTAAQHTVQIENDCLASVLYGKLPERISFEEHDFQIHIPAETMLVFRLGNAEEGLYKGKIKITNLQPGEIRVVGNTNTLVSLYLVNHETKELVGLFTDGNVFTLQEKDVPNACVKLFRWDLDTCKPLADYKLIE
ncbi:MAG: S-layer homology domain-containing protein [Clostridia bacterium]|nr:S-layer homology domain-containing protein [Clostridia bacterium]